MQVDVERFYIYSVVCGVVADRRSPSFLGAPLLVAAWRASRRRARPAALVRRRSAKRAASRRSSNEFPNALDVIVRAVKSGLPLNDGIRLIANEVAGAGEDRVPPHRRIPAGRHVDPRAALRMPKRMPCPEASFFAIVIQIQPQAGGNLSEALGNLSRVLRDRKKMKAKVQALSMEAKASAVIIGALPFIVALPRLPDQPELHHAAVHHEHRPPHPRRLGRLDVDRHLRDAQDDQLRGLEAATMTDHSRQIAHRSVVPDRPAGRHRRLRDRLHRACRRFGGNHAEGAHEVGRARARRIARQAARPAGRRGRPPPQGPARRAVDRHAQHRRPARPAARAGRREHGQQAEHGRLPRPEPADPLPVLPPGPAVRLLRRRRRSTSSCSAACPTSRS